MNDDRFAVRFEVGTDGTSAHVRVVSKDGVAHVIIMGDLYGVQQDAVFEFWGIAEHTVFAGYDTAADIGAGTDFCAVTNDGGGFNGGGFGDFHVFADQHAGFEFREIRQSLFNES